MGHAIQKHQSLGICRQRRPGSACVLVQCDQGLHCMNREQRPGWYFVHVQYDLNLRILCMLDGTFSLDRAHMVSLSFILLFFLISLILDSRWTMTLAKKLTRTFIRLPPYAAAIIITKVLIFIPSWIPITDYTSICLIRKFLHHLWHAKFKILADANYRGIENI